MEDKIVTLHPQGLKGVHISRAKYEQMRAVILQSLADLGPQTFGQLGTVVEQKLRGRFGGSISWYYTAVKLDLETRGEILCTRKGGSEQMLRLGARHAPVQ